MTHMSIAYDNVRATLNQKQQSDLWCLFNAMSPDGENVSPYLAKALKSVIQLAHQRYDDGHEIRGLWKTDGPTGALMIVLHKNHKVCMCEIDAEDWSWHLSEKRTERYLVAA
jgi:hypothetical protein